MINRVILLVIDGLGVGALPDAAEYGDAEADTLAHLAEAVGGLTLPALESLGLGHVGVVKGLRLMAQPIGCFGRLGFRSKGLDALTGHWELAGCVSDARQNLSVPSIQETVVDELERIFGMPLLGKRLAATAQVLREYGPEHLASKAPILWTESVETYHVASHEQVLAPEELYHRCREARKSLKRHGLRRIVAHVLKGEAESLHQEARRDFAVEPPQQTMLDLLNRASQILIGVGRVGDLFAGRGLTRAVSLDSWSSVFEEVTGMFNRVPRGLIYANLNLLEGRPPEAAASLHEFDRKLPELLEQLRPGDLFLLTGDHGRDYSTKQGLPTREFVPLIVTGPRLAQGVNLGTRASAADLGQTIVEALRADALPVGDSFADALNAG